MGEVKPNRLPNPEEVFSDIPSKKSLYGKVLIYIIYGILYGAASGIFGIILGFILVMIGYGKFAEIPLIIIILVILNPILIGYVLCLLSMVKRAKIKTNLMLQLAGFSMGFFTNAIIIVVIISIRFF